MFFFFYLAFPFFLSTYMSLKICLSTFWIYDKMVLKSIVYHNIFLPHYIKFYISLLRQAYLRQIYIRLKPLQFEQIKHLCFLFTRAFLLSSLARGGCRRQTDVISRCGSNCDLSVRGFTLLTLPPHGPAPPLSPRHKQVWAHSRPTQRHSIASFPTSAFSFSNRYFYTSRSND